MLQRWYARVDEIGWVLLPLRAYLGVVFLDGGISKIADRRFLDDSSPLSMRASVAAIRSTSPIGGLLGTVQHHASGFGLAMAFAEIAVGLGVSFGLFTRIAAAGGMLLALSLWLTVSWGATPWFTSADLVYLFALTPLLLAGSAGVLSADGWLAQARAQHPGIYEDRTRRVLLAGAAAVLGSVVLAGASLFRRGATSPGTGGGGSGGAQGSHVLVPTAKVPVGGAVQVSLPSSGDPAYVLQLQPGAFTAFDAVCPHQACTVSFVSAADGFACPCHGSLFDAQGHLLTGPAPHGLTPIPVTVVGADVQTA